MNCSCIGWGNGPLARYVKLRVVHAPGMLGTFSPPPQVSYSDMHHGKCVMHVPWCMPGSLTTVFFKSVAGKMLPTFPAHALPAILRILRKRPMFYYRLGNANVWPIRPQAHKCNNIVTMFLVLEQKCSHGFHVPSEQCKAFLIDPYYLH